MPVVCCSLHSQVAPVCAALVGLRVAYVQLAGGAIPTALSDARPRASRARSDRAGRRRRTVRRRGAGGERLLGARVVQVTRRRGRRVRDRPGNRRHRNRDRPRRRRSGAGRERGRCTRRPADRRTTSLRRGRASAPPRLFAPHGGRAAALSRGTARARTARPVRVARGLPSCPCRTWDAAPKRTRFFAAAFAAGVLASDLIA